MRNICERDAACWDQTLRTCFRFECKTATGSAHAWTWVANAHKKRGIENSFPGTQMFPQAINNKCLQQFSLPKFHHEPSV